MSNVDGQHRFAILEADNETRRWVERAVEAAGAAVAVSVSTVEAARRRLQVSAADVVICGLDSCSRSCGRQRSAFGEPHLGKACAALGIPVVENLLLPTTPMAVADAVKAIASISGWPMPALAPGIPPPVQRPVPRVATPRPTRAGDLGPAVVGQRGCELVAIGSSTGGPAAAVQVLAGLSSDFPVPIVMVQHMLADHLSTFAESMGRQIRRPVTLVTERTPLLAGGIYLASGLGHIVVRRQVAGDLVVDVQKGPPEHNCQPAVDPLFRSVAEVVGAAAVAVVLTGMGTDGALGAMAIRSAGGVVLVQDEESSVVWGMPGATVAVGAADEVIALSDIAHRITRRMEKS
jgi:two-component system, chemotaxis family, protein-glutamate methylesterase/glutaminase